MPLILIIYQIKKNYEFANVMHFDGETQGNKSVRNRCLIGLVKSPAIMASGISTISKFLSSGPNEL